MGQQAYSFLSKLVILFFTSFVLQASAGSLNCTFDDGFCDWTSDKDDDFDWQRGKGVYTGSAPESDHTTGSGYFLYIDATYQQNGDRARITSPVQTQGAHCFTLWYYMNSMNLGALNIYEKTVNDRETLIFTKDTSIRSLSWQKAVISRKTNVEFQVLLEGVRGGSSNSDIAVDDIFMTDGMCTVDCNFEFGMCHWVQDLSDDFDWRRHQGGNSTPNTGPPGDHTSKYGYYIYIDTSEARSNTNSRIFSPWLREGKYCFSFWYYMYGEHVDTLTVRKVDVNKIKSELIEITGEHQQQWIQGKTFIHATSGFQIIIEGTVNNSWQNNDYRGIAIDDVQMLSCQDCADPTPEYGKTNSSNFIYNSTVQITCNSGYTIKGDHIIVCKPEGIWSGNPTCEPVASAGSLNCTFDDGFCGWTSDYDDDFDWQRVNGLYTGSAPESDHTTGYGYFIYINATYQQNGDTARITSPIQTPGAHCLTLWYSMYNYGLGALNIYVKNVNGRGTLIFTKDTSIGSRRWQKAVISHKTNVQFQVVLEGVIGGSFLSDIAVDDIFMTDGMCTVDCNFESGMCHWVQDLSDDFDWRRHQGGNSTPNTGPPGDHTSKYGYYIYIDTSEARSNTNARIFSPWLREGKYCFSFWYYMYGEYVDSITVRKVDVNKLNSEIIEITGEHQQQWIQEKTFIHATSGFQVIIKGTLKDSLGNYTYGLIAIDDVQMLSCQVQIMCNSGYRMKGNHIIVCKPEGIWSGNPTYEPVDCADPTPDYGKTNSSNFTYNSIVQITCNSGYRIRGDLIIVCKPEGIWSGNPTCEPVDCADPTPEYGKTNSSNFTYNSIVQITCNSGYTIKGDHIIVCKPEGIWSGNPTCELVDCADPTPEYGKTNSRNFTYNSIVQITCNSGYTIKGDHIIACKPEGIWSGNPTCEPVDCADPTPEYGTINSSNFRYNSVVQITCNSGYIIKGDHTIVCKPEGIWSGNPTCEPVDCADPTPEYGKTNSDNFTNNSIVQITCNSGYTIKGDHIIVCKPEGIWSGNPTCEPVDCLIPKIAYGIMLGPRNNTTYNKTVDIVCEDGYDLIGNKSITCQADGYWSALPTCDLRQTTNTGALTAVYITVPLAAVALVIVLIAIIRRKRILEHFAIRSSHEHARTEQPQPITLFTNMAYSENFNENQSSQEGDISQDDEYDVIADDRNQTGHDENPVYYNIADTVVTTVKDIEHIYNHAIKPGTPVTDNTYSHLAGDIGMSSSTYNTTAFSLSGNASYQTKTNPENKTYDVLNTKIAKQGCGIHVAPDVKDDQEPIYDHARAGGTDPTDIDDYSHLNVRTDKH